MLQVTSVFALLRAGACRGVQSMSAMSAQTFFVGRLSCMVEVDLVFVTSSDWFAKWSSDARVVCGCNSSVAGQQGCALKLQSKQSRR